MKPARRGRFKVGQVVWHKGRKMYVRITGLKSWAIRGGLTFREFPQETPEAIHHCARNLLRPQTARERGTK